jgi:hypothetical protein
MTIKRCPISLVIRKTQIKITTKYHYSPIKNGLKMMTLTTGEEMESSWWECQMVQSPWKSVWQLLTKLNKHLPYDSEIVFISNCPIQMKIWMVKLWCIYIWEYCSAIKKEQAIDPITYLDLKYFFWERRVDLKRLHTI